MLKKIKVSVAMLILVAILFIIQSSTYATSYTVEYLGKATYGASTVGNFKVNGNQVFCTDHKKSTPPSGTVVESKLYYNEDMIKCLYYGWGGVEQWSFTSETQGIVYTSLALDHFKNGNTNNTAKDFINYVNSMPVPEIELNFSENILTAFLIDEQTQRTQSVTVTGNTQYYMTIQLQDGVTLVNETRGTEETGNVNVYGGDQFYLKAPLTVKGSWTSSDITNHKYSYQLTLYTAGTSSYQELAGDLVALENTTSAINLSVNWITTGELQILKSDEDSMEPISGVTFELRKQDDTVVTQVITDENGYAKVENLLAGDYVLVEIDTDEYYVLDDTPYEITILEGEVKTLELTNKLKTGSVKVVKVDADNNEIKLGGVTFEVLDEDYNVLETIVTDENGEACTSEYAIRDYSKLIIKEIETLEYYILDDRLYEITISEGEVKIIEITNKLKTGSVKVVKVDADDNEIKLEGVTFEILDEDYNVLETIVTDENGEACTSEYAIRDYSQLIIKEVNTIEGYILNDEPQTITLEADEIKTIVFENEKEEEPVEIEEKLPRTGEYSSDTNIFGEIISLLVCAGIGLKKWII